MEDYLNHIKIMIFNPDFFSTKSPQWHKLDQKEFSKFIELCDYIPRSYILDIENVYYSGALEINSTNYKLQSTCGKSILLKKWPNNTDIEKVEKTQTLTKWLFLKKIPVAYPGSFVSKKKSLLFNGTIWSFNVFIDGDYFSGLNNELASAANITGKLAKTLMELPSDLSPDQGPIHLSKEDDLIMQKMLLERNNWVDYFGQKTTNLLNLQWDFIYDNWNNLNKMDVNMGPMVACHFDMHPHNLITQNGEIVAVLDFDSCMKMPLGVSLAFNILKQCRQFISTSHESINYKDVIDLYIENLSKEFLISDFLISDFLNLSKLEVMRRICLIFRLNMLKHNSKWNHALSVQIAHLYESDKLFKYE
tara:strand:+ start:2082 stop:3167 length:1086 start_codon:yes stop_codon:yes gene_type:complete